MVNPGQSFYSFVRSTYGQDILCLVRKLIVEKCRIVRFKEHLTFCHCCKSERLVPKTLRVKPLVQTAEGRRIALRSSLQFIAARISLCHSTISNANHVATSLRARLDSVLDDDTLMTLDSEIVKEEMQTRAKYRMCHDEKLERLRASYGASKPSGKLNPRWVQNLSSYRLCPSEISVLSRGLNFAPAPSSIPVPRILSAIEPVLGRMDEETSAEIRAEVSQVLSRGRKPTSNLSVSEKNALLALRKREDIVVLPSDKGRATVVLDRFSYEEKALNLLSVATTYSVEKKDPTGCIERRMNALLLKLHKESKIDEALYSRLRCSSGRIPLFYGLPKVHKEGVPLRPIVSFCSSPTYALSKHLAGLLSPLVGLTALSVETTEEFLSSLSNVKITSEDIMVSFDVVSLFTCIPTSLAISTALNRLKDDESLSERTKLTAEDICELLEFCLDATYFCFKGTVYKQKHGTAMGSPVSSVVANLCMESLESTILECDMFHVKIWKRYVDDTFVVLPRAEVDDFHRYLNGLNPHIQFTVEVENDGLLPFLDVKVCRDAGGSLLTSVYRKPTHTDRYLDFRSHHPTCHKASVVNCLTRRAITHSSNVELKNAELRRTKTVLKENGYPEKFITRRRRPDRRNERPAEERRTRGVVVLPYVERLSEELSRVLRKADIKTYYKPVTTLRDLLVHVKDRVPQEESTGAIYQIPCKGCGNAYTGETARSVCVRRKEHRRAVENGDMSNLLAKHAWEKGHAPDWNATSVLHKNVTSKPRRLFLESWETYRLGKRATNIAKAMPECYRIFARRWGKPGRRDFGENQASRENSGENQDRRENRRENFGENQNRRENHGENQNRRGK